MSNTENKGPQPNSSATMLKAVIGVVLLALVVVGVMFFMNRPGDKETLSVYYPENSAFFLEFQPGGQLVQGFLNFVEEQEAEAQAMLKQQGLDANLKLPDTQNGLSKDLAKNFSRKFKPQFSVGVWPKTADSTARQMDAYYVMILPLQKPDMAVEALLPELERKAEDFTKKEYKGVPYLVENTPSSPGGRPTVMAVHEGNFLVTEYPEALQTALDTRMEKKPNVFDRSENKKGLAKLPADRQGTFIVNNKVFAADPDPNLDRANKLVPFVFGALRVRDDSLLLADFHMPVFLENIEDAEVRQAVQGLLKDEKNPFRAASVLPGDTRFFVSLGHLDGLLNVKFDHFSSQDEQKNLMGAQMMLGMMEIDLRKDIIGLLNGEVVVAMRENGNVPMNRSIPMLLLSKSQEKDASLNKIKKLASSGMIPLQAKQEQMGSVSVDTYMVPVEGGAKRFGLAAISNDMVALAEASDMDDLVGITDRKEQPLKETALYKELTQGLPGKGTGMLFVNLEGTPSEFIRAIAGVFDSENDQSFTGHVVVKLAPDAAGEARTADSKEAAAAE